MAPDGKSGNGCRAHPRELGVDDQPRRSSRAQRSSRNGKERLLSPRGTETIKYPDKLKAEGHVSPPFIHPHRERRQDLDARSAHQKAFESRLRHSVKGKSTVEDELVRHMSNLPAYLQRIHRGENFQEKLLNVGVLDWTQLEKWKLNQKADSIRGDDIIAPLKGGIKPLKVTSGSSSLATAFSTKTPALRSDSKGPLDSHPGSFRNDGRSQYTIPSHDKVLHSQDSARIMKLYMDRGRKTLSASSPSGRNSSHTADGEGANRKFCSRNNDFDTVQWSGSVKCASESSKGDIQKSEQEGRNVSDAGTTSVSEFARRAEQMGPFDGERKEKEQESEVSVSHQARHRKQKSIALHLPQRFPQSSLKDVFKNNEKKPSTPCLTEPYRISLSDSVSSGVLHSGEMFSEIPRSCPLPSQVESQNKTFSPTVGPNSDASPASSVELHGFRSYAKKHGSKREAAVLDSAADLKTVKQESPEPEPSRSRNPSPNRRFSFSLGRMTRSFSFKEAASIPQLAPSYVSAKSGPVIRDDSACCGVANQEKANPPTRGRSSPLRRLLDPLLKAKSTSSRHTAENIHPPKPVNTPRPLLHEKQEKSIVQALLQITIKNGNLLFKFVVANNSDVLAATFSNSVSARKDGSFRSCTFYSVNEIKRKSISWIGQGNKAKGGGFAYNVVGQMKLSDSPYSGRASKGQSKQIIAKECILFSVDSKQADKQPANTVANTELAAIVFKFSGDENGNSNSVTVILPGGVHGLPNKGEPSPLIQRWKSGGSCDCGGWDVGCKLHVLYNRSRGRKSTKASKTSSTSDHLELYAQGEPQPSVPIFSLTPFREGIYSVEFESSVSLLQAFSISVAFISCQGQTHLTEANSDSGVSTPQEPTTLGRNAVTAKTPRIFQREGPAKYAPCPPLSPVGRV